MKYLVVLVLLAAGCDAPKPPIPHVFAVDKNGCETWEVGNHEIYYTRCPDSVTNNECHREGRRTVCTTSTAPPPPRDPLTECCPDEKPRDVPR